jgi:predicted Rossmann fold nucleotide-binding protein DprA/Smf involved in DNA uptake
MQNGWFAGECDKLDRYGCTVISYLDSGYPKAFEDIYDKPLLLIAREIQRY